MAYTIDNLLRFPAEPPHPTPVPEFNPGQRPADTGVWGSHDPAIYHDPVSGHYYTYCTGAAARRSDDLITWTTLGKVVDDPPPESQAIVGGNSIWAPDIIKVGNEYRMYCSNSSWGVRQSAIFLAVADNAEGPFHPRGVVVATSEDAPCNAIDANLIEDAQTGEQYMVYGSFWGGCHMIQLDPETGLSATEGVGWCVACRPQWVDCAIEGPYIRYNPDTGYYYLFVSYGSLQTDYNIRVGRSRNIKGPYYDANGRCMTDMDDNTNEVGYLLAAGYQFEGGQSWMGPGHNSVLHDFDNQWYLVCHIRPQNFKAAGISTMHIHKLYWTADGWPVASPEQYAGEETQPIPASALTGCYERIKLHPDIPQGILHSVPMELREDGSMTLGSLLGHWEWLDDTTALLCYGNTAETVKTAVAWDWELWRPTVVLTGKDQMSVGVWAKQIPGEPTPTPAMGQYANHLRL